MPSSQLNENEDTFSQTRHNLKKILLIVREIVYMCEYQECVESEREREKSGWAGSLVVGDHR